MKKFRILWLVCSLFVLCACEDKEKILLLTVASEKGSCFVVGEFPCYIVKFNKNDNWTTITESIKGFDYEPGYEYVIKVREKHIKNPPEDYLGEYFLIDVISKEKKDSENLPPKPDWSS